MPFFAVRKFPSIFWLALAIVLSLFLLAVLSPVGFGAQVALVNQWVYHQFGAFYLWFTFLTTLAFLALTFLPIGQLRLGGPDARPAFSFFSWFSMIFCAGMGTGFMFWGAAEPLYHFTHPPLAGDPTPFERQDLAFAFTFFHWGLSPWAIYGLTALAMGFFCFNRQQDFRFSTFLLGSKTGGNAYVRLITDLVTVLAVMFGMAATLGMATLNLEGGLHTLIHMPPSAWLKLLILAFTTVIYIISSCMGMDKGIKVLSNISMLMGIGLLIAILAVGPYNQMPGIMMQSTTTYLARFGEMSLGVANYRSSEWVGNWTIKYWSWWIAWAPFVGVFLAMISRGRTVREIVIGSLIAPTLFSFIWFVGFGQAAIAYQQAHGFGPDILELTRVEQTLFQLLDAYHLPAIVSWISMLFIVLSVANSADSATYTITNLYESDYERRPPTAHLIAWGLLLALLTALLLLGGGMQVLEDITTIMVLPFTILLVFVYATFFKSLAVPEESAGESAEPELLPEAGLS